MEIRPIMRGNTLYVILDGEIDEHNAAVARRTADELIDAYAYAERAVFDLNRVSFMDSTGIGFLIGRYKKFKRFGIAVFLSNPNITADKILSMSGVYALMPKI